MTENVILVDADDNEVGSMQKMEAHVAGVLHRAFSVFIFNSKGELLLQQRAEEKYHSGGKWTNTCCSHPRTGEKTISAAHRRLKEEMGMDCELNYAFNFTYRADVMNGLYENEYDHVYFGRCDDQPIPNPSEVASFRYIDLESLEEELKTNHSQFTEWLKICFDEVKKHFFKLL